MLTTQERERAIGLLKELLPPHTQLKSHSKNYELYTLDLNDIDEMERNDYEQLTIKSNNL